MSKLLAIRTVLAASMAMSLIAAAGAAEQASAGSRLRSIEADGSQFKVTLADGRMLRSPDLVGAVLTIDFDGSPQRIRIDAVETDPGVPEKGLPPSPDIYLHTLSIQSADGSWSNLCMAGPDGRKQALPIAGRARSDATIWPDETGTFELTCTGGAQGKCIRFGYAPWRNASAATYERYNACVRMVRADYSGDGKGTTRNGMLIDLYDFDGIQSTDNASGLEFEAGWNSAGAVCIRHPRVKDNVNLAELDALLSLHGRTGEVCTEEFARAQGAVIFNRSVR